MIFGVLAVVPFFISSPCNKRGAQYNCVTLPKCYFIQNYGKACPACGLTRSVVSIYNGKLESADKFNPMGKYVVLYIWFQLLLRIGFAFKPRKQRFIYIDLIQLIGMAALIRLNM